ncbi:MAG: TonB-dependent receptor [Betaproteobacteria bacterium]|nr:TonB-dependent receptor [Betaproteobacteria bacterium]
MHAVFSFLFLESQIMLAFSRLAGPLCLALFGSSWVGAQVQNSTQGTAPSLAEVVVTGNPLGRDSGAAPVSSLAGTELLLRAGSTLGETLSQTPGVANSYFGPNAGRPVIRGLDGDRIRMLSNGGASHDLSGLSQDHAVAQDPLSIERIEVLRGPGALLYGGSAVGGVVNLIDNRIPQQPMEADAGLLGRFDLNASSGNQERSGAGMVEWGNERWAVHVDGFRRVSGDTAVPIDLKCERTGLTSRVMCNSGNSTSGGALGASMFWDHGRLGASVSQYASLYGTVVEDTVSIDMRSTRYALDGEWRRPGSFLDRVNFQWARTDYRHAELDSGVIGTEFISPSTDYRLQARHSTWASPWGPLQGVWGLQGESSRFEARGNEAYAPFSETQNQALYVHEELPKSWGRWTVGLRNEQVSVGCLTGNALCANPVQKSYAPLSAALGLQYHLAPGWQWSTHVARTERAPKHYELFANGVHVATRAFEVGNADLGIERANQWDVGLAWRAGEDRFSINGFVNQYDSHIALYNTGDLYIPDEGGEAIPRYAFRSVRARFQGVEAQGSKRIKDGSAAWVLGGRADLVRATNLDTQEPLPRISPFRLGMTLDRQSGPWMAGVGLDHAMAQDAVPAGDRATPSSTLLNARLTLRQQQGDSQWLWYARATNLTDALVYSPTSVLTTTAKYTDESTGATVYKAPLPGRSIKLGVQISF